MPGVATSSTSSTGHACFPPTNSQGPYASTAFFNGNAVQLVGHTMYIQHACGRTIHPNAARKVSSGSSTFFFEGKAVARIGDNIACGDMIAEGSSDAFVGG
jgi:uncharacterized Zn-binding protein involved in type VI secretion